MEFYDSYSISSEGINKKGLDTEKNLKKQLDVALQ